MTALDILVLVVRAVALAIVLFWYGRGVHAWLDALEDTKNDATRKAPIFALGVSMVLSTIFATPFLWLFLVLR